MNLIVIIIIIIIIDDDAILEIIGRSLFNCDFLLILNFKIIRNLFLLKLEKCSFEYEHDDL